ncbi:hypothetical protein SLH46_04900 [Draconibacterium sp. IB214405]|uniref:hypothetical protein n=1 Tax=Draconibacterium sp. IB214405 TaxID=3097352 RepID=UPI002A13D5B7|nr:hypothetical protein [Draconibacterium sp. IB214405]MDX8338508.1 hypothetical protein [Draconibacterium sp. IB214405]
MQEVKKQLEVLLVNYFRDRYPDFPKGKVVASESPDFVVKMKNAHKLGIELTRLNPASAITKTEKEEALINFRDELVDDMKELFEAGSDAKLFVKFMFSEKQLISPERELMVRSKTVATIKSAIADKSEGAFFHKILTNPDLPEGLGEVMMAHHPELKESVWERSNNLGISNNVVEDIRLAIAKKDEKLRIYQKQQLQEYWLLITTDCLRADKNINLLNKISHEEFESRFQQVFVLDLMRARVFPLVEN